MNCGLGKVLLFSLRVALLNNRGLRDYVIITTPPIHTQALALSLFCSAFCAYNIMCVREGGERRMDGWMRVESIICMFVATCVHRTYLLLLFSISFSSRLSLGRFCNAWNTCVRLTIHACFLLPLVNKEKKLGISKASQRMPLYGIFLY